jgi:hypothetical protein
MTKQNAGSRLDRAIPNPAPEAVETRVPDAVEDLVDGTTECGGDIKRSREVGDDFSEFVGGDVALVAADAAGEIGLTKRWGEPSAERPDAVERVWHTRNSVSPPSSTSEGGP